MIPRWRAAVLRGRSWFDQVAGLSRPPVLTAALTALTGIVSVAGLISPAVLDTLERTPAALRGEAWRWVTSLLVQDGGVLGTASNLIFLALLGAAAEQVAGRMTMAACYLTAGLSCSRSVSSGPRSTVPSREHVLRSGRPQRWQRAVWLPPS